MISEKKNVALVFEETKYSNIAPYHPSEEYVEFVGVTTSESDNPAFRGVRESFRLMGYDIENYGTADWNPLGDLIEINQTVLLKPNFVTHRNYGEKRGITDLDSLTTHGSILRVVLEYVCKGLNGSGKIIIGDCPLQGSDWDKIIKNVGIEKVVENVNKRFPNIEIIIKDYRLGKAKVRNGIVVERVESTQSIDDYTEVDLKSDSLLIPLMEDGYEFGVSHYSRKRMKKAHDRNTNKYLIPNDFLYADVVINLPKMKSHMKAGITCALKNFVGINGHKDYLPHFRYGSPKKLGDEYPDGGLFWDVMWYFAHKNWDLEKGFRKGMYNKIRKFFAFLQVAFQGKQRGFASIGGGSWYGNDTLWRTILDINRAFFYFDRNEKKVNSNPTKVPKYLSILDGIVGGDHEGPLSPEPVESGYILVSENPVALDSVSAALMNFDLEKIKQVSEAYRIEKYPLISCEIEDIKIVSSENNYTLREIYEHESIKNSFVPATGYKGHIEYVRNDDND